MEKLNNWQQAYKTISERVRHVLVITNHYRFNKILGELAASVENDHISIDTACDLAIERIQA